LEALPAGFQLPKPPEAQAKRKKIEIKRK